MAEGELTCKELVEIVTEYLEGALPPEERRRFDLHLYVCPGCTAYLDQMRETVRLTGMLREDDIEPEVRTQLLEAFRGWQRR